MEIVKIKIKDIKPYEKNAKIHTKEQIEQIKKSIEEFGMNDPIAVWGDENIIVEGHGRLEALKQMGRDEVECIRLDHLTDEERRAYTLAHNKLTMNTGFDFDILNDELMNFETIDMQDFGFDLDFELGDTTTLTNTDEDDNPYTSKINIPQYEITGEKPTLAELVDTSKTRQLIDKIKQSNVPDDEKEFLINAAQRHLAFNYSKVAEYYAHSDKEMQQLMEESALVIIDYNDAIKNGYAELIDGIEAITEYDDESEE